MNEHPLRLSLIAAIGKKRELGKDNKLLWNIPSDMKHFREKTRGHAVIMGRRTFESIGRPLPDRTNIIVTLDENYHAPEGVFVVHSIEKALARAKEYEEEEVFVIGGGLIYSLALPYADKLYLTIIDKEFPDADAFFPEYDTVFKKIVTTRGGTDNGYTFTFLELER